MFDIFRTSPVHLAFDLCLGTHISPGRLEHLKTRLLVFFLAGEEISPAIKKEQWCIHTFSQVLFPLSLLFSLT